MKQLFVAETCSYLKRAIKILPFSSKTPQKCIEHKSDVPSPLFFSGLV